VPRRSRAAPWLQAFPLPVAWRLLLPIPIRNFLPASATFKRGQGVRIGIAPEHGSETVYTLAVGARTATPLIRSGSKFRATAWLDVDGDGVAEYIVWDGDDPTLVALRDHQPRTLHRVARMLLGARDVAAIRARMPLLHGYNAPADGISASEVLLSIQFATDDQIRALIDPKGITLCEEATGNAKPHYRKCKTIAAAKLTTKLIEELILDTHVVEDYQGQPYSVRGRTSGGWVPEVPTCKKTKTSESCSANMGGPGDYEWVFTGSGSTLRLREISSVVYESS
jgi:hypothetical protein